MRLKKLLFRSLEEAFDIAPVGVENETRKEEADGQEEQEFGICPVEESDHERECKGGCE